MRRFVVEDDANAVKFDKVAQVARKHTKQRLGIALRGEQSQNAEEWLITCGARRL